MIYFAVVHKEHGTAFGLSFPDLPGCFSAADDIRNILAEAGDAIAIWAEDYPLPEPRSIEQVRMLVADELRIGAFLLGVDVRVMEEA